MGWPRRATARIDLERPNAARVYDYLLGGGCNFEAGRAFAQKLLACVPEAETMLQHNRAFLGRAVRFCVGQGIRQFLDLGSGIPTVGNVHEIAGHGAEAVRDAITARITTLPEQLCRSLTWDRGKELAQHARFTIDTGVAVYFADPHSPWQRGTNENTNGLLRQYFPKGTDLSRWSTGQIDAVATALNSRPRKTLGWKTPAETLDELLSQSQSDGVATTD